MNDVVTRGISKLPKTTWPQDTLRVPDGYGRMTMIGARNDLLVGQEYFCNSATSVVLPLTTGSQIGVNIPVGNDGDFWLTNITMACVENDVIALTQDVTVTLTDNLTGYNVFTPFIHINTLFTPLQGSRINWDEPYCFPRRSSMVLNFTRQAQSGFPTTIYIACQGWKEYANAVQ